MKQLATKMRHLGELKATLTAAVTVLAAAVIITGAAEVFARTKDLQFGYLSRDAATVLGGSFYTSYHAHLTVLVWQVSATVALLGSAILRRAGRSEPSRLLFVAGAITALMVLDDFFLLHEGPYRMAGISDLAISACYGVAVAAFAWRFRRRLGAGGLVLVAATFGAWAVSALTDSIDVPWTSSVLEDGAKMAGVGLWCLLLVRVTWTEVVQALVHRDRDVRTPVRASNG